MRPDICIYHGNCADGFGAAWAVRKRFPDIEFIAGTYGAKPPDIDGKGVLMVDFSYKKPVLQAMSERAAWIVILDHHKTAEADLAEFANAPFDSPGPDYEIACGRKIAARFDMSKSGAILAWEFMHPGQPIPTLLRYIQDRDLWKFDLPASREIAACVFSHPYDFKTWDWLAIRAELTLGLQDMIAEGEAIERKHKKDIAELLPLTRRKMVIGGVEVPVANLPYTMSSDAAGALAEDAPFGACYFDRNDGWRVFSLRSKPHGADVSEIAASYGGGGHRNAAGFQMPVGWEGDRPNEASA